MLFLGATFAPEGVFPMRYLTLAVLAALFGGCAGAVTITLNNVDGSFLNALPTPASPAYSISNGPTTSSIRWGTPTEQFRSGYIFTADIPPAVSVTLPPSPSGWFQLGTFTHRNWPITGDTLSQVNLDVAIDVNIGGTPVNRTYTYSLSHYETPNTGRLSGCQAFQQSATPCDDRVQISGPTGATINVGGVDYTLFLGFSSDGGNTILNQFITEERKNNVAGLYARWELPDDGGGPNEIPEPATYLMLGTGLLGLTWLRRR
jgi:hypothetical protein